MLYNPIAILLLCFSLLVFSILSYCQEVTTTYDKALAFPTKLLNKINSKAIDLNERADKQTSLYLQRVVKQEKKLQRQLSKKDSVAANRIFENIDQQYAGLKDKVHRSVSLKTGPQKYIGHLDSLHTALAFTQGEGTQTISVPLTASLYNVKLLQEKLSQTEEISKIFHDRKRYLQEQLGKYGMSKQLEQMKKEVFYYRAQLDEYKQIIETPSKLEKKAIELLAKTTEFKDFFHKHSQLAGLFPTQDGNAIAGNSLAGLQTRSMVQQGIAQRLGGASNAQQLVQNSMQVAQGELQSLKNKINQYMQGNTTTDIDMPDFQPNPMRTKTFWKRLDPGINIQSKGGNRWLPSTTDIALSLGYRLNKKNVFGLAVAYKIGLGMPLRDIRFSNQGIGFRSYADVKMKGSFWISGGYEYNYMKEFRKIPSIQDPDIWQRSALLGLTKKYSIGKKKGSVQLLYDFLWKQQSPSGQQFLFRTGYSL